MTNLMANFFEIDNNKARYDAGRVGVGNPVADESVAIVRGNILMLSRERDQGYSKAQDLTPTHTAIPYVDIFPQTRLSSFDLLYRRSGNCNALAG